MKPHVPHNYVFTHLLRFEMILEINIGALLLFADAKVPISRCLNFYDNTVKIY